MVMRRRPGTVPDDGLSGHATMSRYFVYILANRRYGVLYVA
jgi:hypothetical protein